MIKSLFSATALTLILAAAPASAQLLGGSGGLGGTLGGGLGGGLGGIAGAGDGRLGGSLDGTMGRLPVRGDNAARTTGSARADKHVNARNGHASASGSAAGDGVLDSSTVIGRSALGGSATGSMSGSGGADAQLIGTDAVRGATGRASGIARGAVGTTRGTASGALSGAGNAASNGYGAAGSAAGSGSGMASGNLGQLALAGTAAANGAGSFAVAPGMAVTDTRGRVIGAVQSVRTTARGTVQQVVMQVGKRTATLPAANFSGSGNVLVSAMGKGEVKDAAKK